MRLLGVVLIALFSTCLLAITFISEPTVNRYTSGTSTFYNVTIEMEKDTGKQRIHCDFGLSNDNISGNSDIWLSANDDRCSSFNDCPDTSEFIPETSQGVTISGKLLFEDRGNKGGNFFAFLTCIDREDVCDSFFTDSNCFNPQSIKMYAFSDGFNEPLKKLSQATVVKDQETVEVGKAVTFSVNLTPANAGALSYSWEIDTGVNAQTPTASHTFTAAGVYIVNVTISNFLGQIRSSIEINIKDNNGNDDGDSGNTEQPKKSNGGVIAGVIIGILFFIFIIGFVYWYLKKNGSKLFAKKENQSMSVTELNFKNTPNTVTSGMNEIAIYGGDDVVQESAQEYPAFTRNYDEFVQEIQNAQISPLVTDCCEYLKNNGYDVEGIFRVPGSQIEMQSLKQSYERGEKVNLSLVKEPLTVAGLLKLYFREGKEEVIPKSVYQMLISAGVDTEKHRSIVFSLSGRQIQTIRKILDLFDLVISQSEVNLMHADNLAKVFGPSLFRDMPVGSASSVMAVWIKNHQQIFGL